MKAHVGYEPKSSLEGYLIPGNRPPPAEGVQIVFVVGFLVAFAAIVVALFREK